MTISARLGDDGAARAGQVADVLVAVLGDARDRASLSSLAGSIASLSAQLNGADRGKAADALVNALGQTKDPYSLHPLSFSFTDACGGVGNYNAYCNPEVDKLIDQQSMEANQEKRRQLVWEIERRLVEDGAKPLMFFNRGGICWDPAVKGLTVMVNSIYNGWRMEDVWLDR